MRGSSRSSEGARPRGPGAGRDPRLAQLVHLLDQAFRIPGTSWRVGLDAILGFLFPGGGDVLGAALSAAVVLVAVRQGLPRVVVARMVFNVAVDTVLGAIPVLGDLFDVAWKANTRNLRLLERYAGRPTRPGWRDWVWVGALLGGLALAALGALALAVVGLRALGAGLW